MSGDHGNTHDAQESEALDELRFSESAGLQLPPAYQNTNGLLVIRTPRATIQHRGAVPGDHYPMIDESHFGLAADLDDPQNGELAPSRVSLKREGEPADTFNVTGLSDHLTQP